MTYALPYICGIVQKNRIKPAKYRHYLSMDINMYNALHEKGIITPEQYFIEESAFFQYNDIEVIISFINIRECNDLHLRILSYLVNEWYEYNPIKRGGQAF